MANTWERKPGEDDKAYYFRIAKTADQRLIRLERLQGELGFEKVLNWSYAKAKKNIERWSEGSDGRKPRFNRSVPDSPAELRAKIKDIEEFLNAPSSQKASLKRSYVQRANTLNANLGTSLKWTDIATFFERDGGEMKIRKYGSSDAFKTYSTVESGKAKKTVSDKKLAQMIKKNEDLSEVIDVDDELVKDQIIEMLKNNDLKPKDLETIKK